MSGTPNGRAPAGEDAATGERRSTGPASETRGTEPTVDDRGDEPPARCPYCDRPFRRPRYERLHRGREHPDRLSDRERAALERAVRAERERLRRVRLYAVGTVVVLYFGLLIVAAFVV